MSPVEVQIEYVFCLHCTWRKFTSQKLDGFKSNSYVKGNYWFYAVSLVTPGMPVF